MSKTIEAMKQSLAAFPANRIGEIPKIRELKEAYAQGRYDESMAQGPSPQPDLSQGLAALATRCGAGTTTDGKSILFKLSQLNEFVERIAANWVACTTPPQGGDNVGMTKSGGDREELIEDLKEMASDPDYAEMNAKLLHAADMLATDARLETSLAEQKTTTEAWKARCERRVADIALLCERHQKTIDGLTNSPAI